MSGQCYLSHAIGGRSANRGVCAQPCRKLYSLIDAEGKMLLKDKHIIELDDEKKASMVSNLLVVLCADESARPVINAGTIY